ncbi:hypothetical protein MPSEU_000575100 [Mayamaea pseudoterrestris]|nr:hypothetical protein MPSEU_000575100 [Mayamaea pseudoterrestris]
MANQLFIRRRALCVLYALVILVSSRADDGFQQYNRFTVCGNSAIEVQDLSIVCDSPGAYYYGSNKYRNSADCQGGDKVKISIQFYLQEALEGDAYVTIEAKGYGSVSSHVLHQAESLCSISSLKSLEKQSCGSIGLYSIQEQFSWSDKNDEYEYSFTPKLVVGFASNANKQVYDLGGANTNSCSGDTFTNWTKGLQKSAANTIKTFFATFGILLGAIFGVLVVGWCLMRQANAKPKEFIVQEPTDENEYHKMAMMGDQMNNLVDI